MTPGTLPALVDARVHHTRHRPLRHAFDHTAYLWLLDVDDPPNLPRWARPFTGVRGEDHLSERPGLAQVKQAVVDHVADAGVDTTAVARVIMLTGPRSLGHTFDPMTAYWCLSASSAVIAVVIEVRNTYGGRHVYVLDADRGDLDKAFVVSPFNDTAGHYVVRASLGPRRIAVSVRLVVDEKPWLTATVSGELVPVTSRTLARMIARRPLMSQRVSALIRVHGIWLWMRRLPVIPRPDRTNPARPSHAAGSHPRSDPDLPLAPRPTHERISSSL